MPMPMAMRGFSLLFAGGGGGGGSSVGGGGGRVGGASPLVPPSAASAVSDSALAGASAVSGHRRSGREPTRGQMLAKERAPRATNFLHPSINRAFVTN
jgi:hypothetical protein